jgi:hypothetical protein
MDPKATGAGAATEDLSRYRRLVGKLNYLLVTRLGITFTQCGLPISKYSM